MGLVLCVKEGKFVFVVNYGVVKYRETRYTFASSSYGILPRVSYILSHKTSLFELKKDRNHIKYIY